VDKIRGRNERTASGGWVAGMNVGDEVYEVNYSYVTLKVVDKIAESCLVERMDGLRFWIRESKLRKW
jgi:hypothetical protein